jgi:hypothetical protein
MDNYEIRIVKQDQAIAVHRTEHINDHAAIRRGHALAEAGDQVEIWRGTHCVYAGQKIPQKIHETGHGNFLAGNSSHGAGGNV